MKFIEYYNQNDCRFKHINKIDFISAIDNKGIIPVKVTRKEIESVKNTINNPYVTVRYNSFSDTIVNIVPEKDYSYKYTSIFKYSDEWYFIREPSKNNSWYMCDGFQGVLEYCNSILKYKFTSGGMPPLSESQLFEIKEEKLYNLVNDIERYNTITRLPYENFTTHESKSIEKFADESMYVDRYYIRFIYYNKVTDINKFYDEYYIISRGGLIYLCDGLQGVLNCLTDLRENYLNQPPIKNRCSNFL